MRLRDLLPRIDVPDAANVDVTRVDIDSRSCEPGSVFFALRGTSDNGGRYIDDAVARGAVVVVSSEAVSANVPVVKVEEDLIVDAMVTASYLVVGGIDGIRLVGVTGTNGKTSVTNFVAQMVRALGHPASTIGTLTSARTTPAAPELARLLSAAQRELGSDAVVAMEVSSHALDQHRVDHLTFEVGVFTNLTHDHLDYHHTMDAYFAAKAQLFESGRTRHAVVCVDDEWGARLADLRPDATRLSVRDVDDVDVKATSISFTWRGQRVWSHVGGLFNVTNVVLACEAVAALGFDPAAVAAAAGEISVVPGRFEIVSSEPLVVVDYAHTPDGLDRVLGDVAQRTPGRVIVVFGCGGDRDREKRPVMGRIASERADVVYVTNDNPRREDPNDIARAIASGCTGDAIVNIVLDRRDAISAALSEARGADVVVIAGKGHEKTQETNGFVVDFDDVVVARKLLER